MYDRILVPLDGSEVAETVLPFVACLARGLNARVTLLTVVDPADQEVAGRSTRRSDAAGRTMGRGGGAGLEVVSVRNSPVPGDTECEDRPCRGRGCGCPWGDIGTNQGT